MPKTYKIPVIWQMTKIVEIQAESLDEACEKAVEESDASGGDYVSCSM